ncbi:MAG: hypothetical protein MUE44_18160 [Oscillatoriaceae cyanobacterium Prado104]|jgi:hypothetical protein|nr:hypothetical protein [Oscillatoriaceae cyanobacterium Prado104]
MECVSDVITILLGRKKEEGRRKKEEGRRKKKTFLLFPVCASKVDRT